MIDGDDGDDDDTLTTLQPTTRSMPLFPTTEI